MLLRLHHVTTAVLRANLFIANPTRNAYPDTQAEVSVTNAPEHVVRKHSKTANLQGLLGKPQAAQYADLAFRLKTDKGKLITLRLRKPGLFLPEAINQSTFYCSYRNKI